jgi:phosphoribosylglycinamide formyltransferase-1
MFTPISEQYINLAIFASGTGSNAKKIIEWFLPHPTIKVGLIVCNRQGAGVLNIAAHYNIPVLQIEKDEFFAGNGYLNEIEKAGTNFIALAGFLWRVPEILIQNFRNRIINVHPALLPKFGGKGMYGLKVHEAVIAAGEKESGITIHYVDEHYDNGDVIFQASCPIYKDDTPKTLAERIHQLEHENFARIIEETIRKEFA